MKPWEYIVRFEPGEDASPLACEERERVAAALRLIHETPLEFETEPATEFIP